MGKNKASLMLLLVGFYTGTFQIISNKKKTTVLPENFKINISISRWDVVVVQEHNTKIQMFFFTK